MFFDFNISSSLLYKINISISVVAPLPFINTKTSSPDLNSPSSIILSTTISITSFAVFIFMGPSGPGSPCTPGPIISSSSASVKSGCPVVGIVHGLNATANVLVVEFTSFVISIISSLSFPCSASAPATLKLKNIPAIPLLFSSSPFGALAISSYNNTLSTSIPSSFAMSIAIPPLSTSPS